MTHRRRLLVLLTTLWLVLACGVVRADDGLPRTALNLDPAHLPSYEQYPVWSYTVDFQVTDGALRQLAHAINGMNLGKAWVLKLAIRTTEYAVSWRLPAALTDALQKVVTGLRTLLWQGNLAPLITAAIVLTGLVALSLAVLRGRTRAAWGAALRLFVVLVLGAMVTGAAGTWAPSLLSLAADLNGMVFTEVSRVAAPATAGSRADQLQKWALTNTADTAWRYFVHDPWAVQEYGSLQAAGRHARDGVPGAEVLTMATSARTDWYWRQPQATREQDLSWWSEDGLPRRLTLAVVYTVGAFLYAGALFLLAGGMILQQLLVLLLTMAAPAVFVLGLWPGVGQALLTRWAQGLLRSLVGQTVLAVLLGLNAVLTAVVSGLETTAGWELVALLLTLLSVAMFATSRYLALTWRRSRGRAPGQRVPAHGQAPKAAAVGVSPELRQARAVVQPAPGPQSVPPRRPQAGTGTDPLVQELEIQRKRALLSEYQGAGVVRPTGLPPSVARETIAPVHTLIHQGAAESHSAPHEPPPTAAGGGLGAVAPPRDPREGRPLNLIGAGKRPVR